MPRRLLRSYLSRCRPAYPEQRAAVAEILHGECALDLRELEGVARAASEQLDRYVHVDCPGPRFLAAAHRIPVRPDACLPEFACYRGGIIWHRPHRDARRVGCAIYHEIAEVLAPRGATHTDVQLLGIALSIAPDVAQRAVRSPLGLARSARLLARWQRHVPAWTVWVRLVMVVAAESEEAA